VANLLATQLWQTTLLFLIVLALMPFLRRAPARVRHALWLCVLIRFVLPPVGLLPTPSYAVNDRAAAWLVAPFSFDFAPLSTAPPSAPPEAAASGVAATSAPAPVWPWLLGLYGVGVAWLVVRLVRQVVILRRLVRESEPAGREPTRRLSGLRKRAGIGRRVGLRRVRGLASPLTLGVFRPVILLPSDLLRTLQARELDLVLLHELVHVKRHDLAIHWLTSLVSIVYFFHPAAWLLARRIASEREQVADELAMQEGEAAPMLYGETLIKVAALGSTRAGLPAQPAMAAGTREIETRIRGIRTAPRARGGRWSVALAVAVLLASVTLSPGQEREASEPTGLDAWLQARCSERGIKPPAVKRGGPRLTAGAPAAVVFLSKNAEVAVAMPPVAPAGKGPFTRPTGSKDVLKVKVAVAEGAPLYRANGREARTGADLDGIFSENRMPGVEVFVVLEPGTVRFDHVARLVASSWNGGVKQFFYNGVPMTEAETKKLKAGLKPLESLEAREVLVVTDRAVPWERHARLLMALALMKIDRIAFAVVDAGGRLSKLPMYLPRDVPVVEEIIEEEEEIVEQHPPGKKAKAKADEEEVIEEVDRKPAKKPAKKGSRKAEAPDHLR